MDMKPFKLDIDELISTFAMDNSTTLAAMKRIWLSMKFSFIFEASPSTNQACFMQSLYAHTIGYLVSNGSLSHRLGGLYCLYCLFETQPFKPPFKIYLSLGEMKRLKDLVRDAKAEDIKVVSSLVKIMLEKNMFLFGVVDMKEGSVTERVNELTDIQNARIQMAYKKLFANTRLEDFIHMDLGMELDVNLLKKRSMDYAAAKELAIREASGLVDVQDIKHLAEHKQLIGEVIDKTAKDWDVEKGLFYQQTGSGLQLSVEHIQSEEEVEHSKRQKLNENARQEARENWPGQENGTENVQKSQEDEEFGKELEEALLALPHESEDDDDNEQPENDDNY